MRTRPRRGYPSRNINGLAGIRAVNPGPRLKRAVVPSRRVGPGRAVWFGRRSAQRAAVAAGLDASPVGAQTEGNSSALPGGDDIGVPVGQRPDHGAVDELATSPAA